MFTTTTTTTTGGISNVPNYMKICHCLKRLKGKTRNAMRNLRAKIILLWMVRILQTRQAMYV